MQPSYTTAYTTGMQYSSRPINTQHIITVRTYLTVRCAAKTKADPRPLVIKDRYFTVITSYAFAKLVLEFKKSAM